MGIQGLIPFVEKASIEINIRNLAGASVAVDSYCWLHKGSFGCADKLIRGEYTDLYIKYCLRYVEMLLSYRMNVIMVFDGCHLPAKRETEKKRSVIRKEARLMAQKYLRDNDVEKARSYMRRAVDITHDMALQLIKECRKRGVDCIVAPYEADAQMAWLNKVNLVEYIITEDSDLLLFGAQKILFKLDLEGRAVLVDSEKLPLTMGCKPQKYTFEKFRRMCILAGCDYVDSLPGVGLKKACKFMLITEEDDMTRALRKIPQYLNMPHLKVTDEYIENFLKAEATFRHMYIYNPLKRKMERLNDLTEFHTDEKLCINAGELILDEEQAFQLALGNLNPFSLIQVDNWHPDELTISYSTRKKIKCQSIWLKSKIHQENYNEHNNPYNLDSKNILHGNMLEAAAQDTLDEDKAKLDETEVFSLYNCAKEDKNKKRKRSVDIQENESVVETEEENSEKSVRNPFRIIKRTNIPKNITCDENETLLRNSKDDNDKQLSQPTKEGTHHQNKVEVKSRFFAENHKLVAKESSIRDTKILDMLKSIENESQSILNRQQQLYVSTPNSPESQLPNEILKRNITDNDCITYSTKQKNNEAKQSSDDDFKPISNGKNLKDNCIEICDDEIINTHSNIQLTVPFIKLDKRKIGKRSGLQIPKKNVNIDELGKSNTKKLNEFKQFTLSQFNFQKKTILKKS